MSHMRRRIHVSASRSPLAPLLLPPLGFFLLLFYLRSLLHDTVSFGSAAVATAQAKQQSAAIAALIEERDKLAMELQVRLVNA